MVFALNQVSINTITKKHRVDSGVEIGRYEANSTLFSPSKMSQKLTSCKNKIKCSWFLCFSSKIFFLDKTSRCNGNAQMGQKMTQL